MLIILVFSLLSLSSATEFSYSRHCSSIVPQSPSNQSHSTLLFPLSKFHTAFGGGQGVFDPTSFTFSKSFVFRAQSVYSTNTPGLLNIQADFIFPAPHLSNHKPGKSLIRLFLNGFWSQSSGQLCMVGSTASNKGTFPDFHAVLKLQNVWDSSNVSSVITGTLECLNSSCFRPISILMLPQLNYRYTLIPQQIKTAENSPSITASEFCNEGWWPPNGFHLKYDKKGSPFHHVTPSSLFVSVLDCSDKEQRLRVLVEFSKTSSSDFYLPFYPNTTLVGEGYWDEKQLSIIAWRFLNIDRESSVSSASVGDCSIRLSLIFSATLSMRDSGNIVGKIWSSKTVKDPDFFSSIMFYSSENRIVSVPGLEYKYTESERVKKLCTETVSLEQKGATYPNRNSINMRFEMYASSSQGKVARGYAIPFSVDDQFYGNSGPETKYRTLVNMSYKVGLEMLPGLNLSKGIFLQNASSNRVEISAEGTYNEKSGNLCMVGCRKPGLDCEILLKFQFSPWGNVNGRIESKREKTDPLFFEPLETSSAVASSITEIKNVVWRMNMEMAISLVTSSFSCVFVGLQCFHGKKQPEVVPLISTLTLSILSLANLLPLVENLGSLLSQNGDAKHVFVGIGESLEANELMLCLLEMVLFFFQFHLLRLIWNARLRDEKGKRLWNWEKNGLLVCVLIYGAVGLVSWVSGVELSSRSCKEVMLNGFLVPQIMLNLLRESNDENVLCSYFYVGTTLVNLVPEIFSVYAGYYGNGVLFPLWETVVMSEGVVFGSVVYWQQRFGGTFLFWQRDH